MYLFKYKQSLISSSLDLSDRHTTRIPHLLTYSYHQSWLKTARLSFYTHRQCPYAHRVHITLAELGIPFEEEQIDLEVPRTEAYLKINPRGKVPALSYNGKIITESAIIAKFLADAYPSPLVPPSNSVDGALRRAQIDFFVDTYVNNVLGLLYKGISAKTDAEAEKIGHALVENIVKEIEPELNDAAPYFGGSDKVTLAEALVASFVIRLLSLGRSGILFKEALSGLEAKAPNFFQVGSYSAEDAQYYRHL
ncbi:hypothetical protein CEP52_012167 [Fusarium oligoseptatum]|uniref:GST N-terminal domain-containing protein n=1 Tax=Fusarium oligoseptatum TaxID=2604345 RepID=A0A428SZS2_9HYPO|nr:hypothetical protein CEP52_012167 [Fusarium oligoseptatum]